MHVVVDLGFRSLVVVAVSFLVPVIGFLVGRHKWRAAAARNEDIRRLLLLAAEEAARAELEVTAGYGVVSSSQNSGYGVVSGSERWESRGSYCAVCYCPTTNRCARCKSVRYCSAKCQIVHWRQGHKDNCHPPHIVDENIDKEDYGGPQLTQENVEIKTDRLEVRQSTEKFSEEPTITNAGCPPEILCLSDDDSDDEFLARKETNSPSGSSATSFSGFSSTTNSSGSSDDVSVSESVSSFEPERSDGHQSVNDSLDILRTSFNVDQIDQAKPLSPKFASLVESVDGFAKVSKSNQVKPSCKDEENVRISVSPSGFHHNATSEGPVTEPCTVSSDFWGRTLDYVGSWNDAHASNSGLANNNKTSHSSDDTFPDSSGLIKSVHGDDTSEKITGDLKKVNKSPSLSFQGSNDAGTGSTSVSHPFRTREIKSVPPLSSKAKKIVSERVSTGTDALYSSRVVPTSSERSNHFVNNCGRTVNFTEAGCPSFSGSDARLASSVRGSSVPIVVLSQGSNSSSDRNGSKTSVLKAFDHFRGPKVSKNYPMGVGSEIAGCTEKELFPYEVFVKLYNWNKVELQPSGLINCGNSCYANAVLQCLAFTPPLTAYLLQGLHSGGCAKKEWCFMCEFESLIGKAKEGKSPLSPIGILSQLRKVGSQLGNGREEDAHEFLRYAIDTMQSVCLMEAGVNVSNPSKEETTLMGLTFGGYLRSKIKCTRCQGKSERQERMMDLTVEIEGDIGTLEEALRRFTGTEILDGENKYQCSRCKSYEKAKKKLTILEAPNILTIALKRFQSGKFGKINKPIRFPEILDLAPYMSGTSDKSPIYKLFGVVVHLDVMNAAFSGHYVCYVKNFQNKWFKIDDSTVTAVELDKVLTNRAYMLLYSRCSARAPRLIRNRLLSYDPKYRAIPSWISGKTSSLKSLSPHPSVAQHCSSNPQGNSTSSPPLQRISKDSSSDNSSLLSSRSEEGSCSTDSTRYSTSTDDLSDYIFGDSGHGWNSPWRNCSDSDTSSSSSSPPSSRHSPLSDSNRYASSSETMGLWDSQPVGDSLRSVDSDGKVSNPFLDSDTIEQCRKLASSSSRYRETDSERLVLDSVSDVKCRKSTGRTVNI